jgi:hypothetical protein
MTRSGRPGSIHRRQRDYIAPACVGSPLSAGTMRGPRLSRRTGRREQLALTRSQLAVVPLSSDRMCRPAACGSVTDRHQSVRGLVPQPVLAKLAVPQAFRHLCVADADYNNLLGIPGFSARTPRVIAEGNGNVGGAPQSVRTTATRRILFLGGQRRPLPERRGRGG